MVVRQAYRPAGFGGCSANVVLPQSVLSQNNRLTRNRITTSRPDSAVSDNRRR